MTAGSGQTGIFLKTLSPHIVEVLEDCGLDFAIVDSEHAPFDRAAIDMMMLAGRATGLPLYVRVPDRSPAAIQSALDLGACGVVVPHVDSPEIAREAVAAARYIGGKRGFSGGTRQAGYGTLKMAAAIERGDRARVIVQIEHPDAVRDADAILNVPGVDGILVGRADLALSMGYTSQGPEVAAAVAAMLAALNANGRIIGMVAANAAERAEYAAMGANWFVMGTDHGLLRAGATAMLGGK